MNIAEKIVEYYDSSDFSDGYIDVLYDHYINYEKQIKDIILIKFNIDNYETEKYFKNHIIIDKEQCDLIYNYIKENFYFFIRRFNGYYAGYTSLCSVTFGEQETLLSFFNHRTKKDYGAKYLKKIFSKEFYVSGTGTCAYYCLDGGVHADLLNSDLDSFLITIKK